MYALQASDWTRLLELAPPDEMPLYDYRAALLEWARRNDTRTDFTLTDLSTESQISGDTARVTLNAAGTTESGNWSVSGGCYTSPDEYAPESAGEQAVPVQYCLAKTPISFFDLFWGAPGDDGPSEITTVQREGRWFVSPAGTALDVLDYWVENIDDRGLYTLLGLPEAIPPDGAIRLGETVTVPGGERGAHVYTLEGRRGQRLLGLVKSQTTSNGSYYENWATVFDASGEPHDGLFYGDPTELPADGTYLVTMFNYSGADTDVTIWNEDDAPEAARQSYDTTAPPGFDEGSSCEVTTPTTVSGGAGGEIGLCQVTTD
jgi:hypothetical protein